MTGGRDTCDFQRFIIEFDCFPQAAGAIIQPERPINQQDIEAKKADYRPGANGDENHTGDETDTADYRHKDKKPPVTQRAIGCKNCKCGFFRHGPNLPN